jgi:curved DNA-binding protein CbpA
MNTDTSPVNYYAVLGVNETADQATIRKQYRALAFENHPDRFLSQEEKSSASEKFKLIREAYEVLLDSKQRRRYDSSRRAGTEFHREGPETSGAVPTLAEIFSDVDRFEFPTRVHHITSANLSKLINDSIISTDSLKEKVIAVYQVRASDICSSPLPEVRGAVASAASMVITNFRVLVAVTGSSAYRAGNTQYSQNYWGGITSTFMAIDQIEIVSKRASSQFDVRFYGPDTPISGTTFTVKGAVGPILWIANLYGIRLDLIIRIVPVPNVYGIFGVVSAILGMLTCVAGGILSSAFFFYAIPILALSAVAWWENWESAVYARLYRLSGRPITASIQTTTGRN